MTFRFFCIDPTIGDDQAALASSALTSGSAQLTPYRTWNSAPYIAPSTVKQKRGTTAYEAHTFNATGTSISGIMLCAYPGDTGIDDRPIINAESTTGPCIKGAAIAFVTVKDLQLVGGNNAAAALSITGNSTRGPKGIRVQNVLARNCVSGDGIGIGGGYLGSTADYSDVQILSCTCCSNGGGGIDFTGHILGSVSIEYCVTYDNCGVQNTWNIHVQTNQDKWDATQISSLGANVYEASTTITGTALIREVSVVRSSNSLDWRMTAVTSASKNALNVGEYCVDGNVIRIKAGGALGGFSGYVLRASYADSSGVFISDCIAYGARVVGTDGTGIGLDCFMKDSIIKRCHSYNNGRGGFELNNTTNCEVSYSYSHGNTRAGFNTTLGNGGNKIINCTAASNSVNFYINGGCRTTDAILNVIAIGPGDGLSSEAVSGSASVQAVIVFGASACIGFASAVTINPVFYGAAAPLIASATPAGSGGVSVASTRGKPDFYGRYPGGGGIPKGCTYYIAKGAYARTGI